MTHQPSSRRQFLVTSSGALAGTTLLAGGYFSELSAQDDKPRPHKKELAVKVIERVIDPAGALDRRRAGGESQNNPDRHQKDHDDQDRAVQSAPQSGLATGAHGLFLVR